jgi:hypothetical protein
MYLKIFAECAWNLNPSVATSIHIKYLESICLLKECFLKYNIDVATIDINAISKNILNV